MDKKNILVITNMYPTEEHQSFGIFVKNQVEALRNRGLHIDVVPITNPNSGKINVLMKYGTWLVKTLQALLTKGKKYNVVHAHYIFPSGALAYLFKKYFGTRFIVTSHGGDIDKMARKSPRFFQWTKKILHAADHVIVVGDELYENVVVEFGVPEEKVSLINMGVNRQIFHNQSKMDVRASLGMANDDTPILFVGNMLKQKGLLELVEAISQILNTHPNIKLYLIGAQKDAAFAQELQELVNEKGIGDRVISLGVMNQREIAKWMAAAEIFVLPSHIEGFGLVALEAMACGTPVIGTNVGGLKYLLADQAGRIIQPFDPKAIEEAISDLILNGTERALLIKNGEKKAEENDQERLLDQVMDVYFPTGG